MYSAFLVLGHDRAVASGVGILRVALWSVEVFILFQTYARVKFAPCIGVWLLPVVSFHLLIIQFTIDDLNN